MNVEKVQSYTIAIVLGTIIVTGMVSWGMIGTTETTYAGTVVPGHARPGNDADGNGYPDKGVAVNGKYESVYAYDASGEYYWDLGDGRVQGSAGSVEELDEATLTKCVYQVQYRGMFENDPFLDSGWIKNEINCAGVDKGTYNSTIVHKTDPRYEGDPENSIWGEWEYHVNTESSEGNIANLTRPERHLGR